MSLSRLRNTFSLFPLTFFAATSLLAFNVQADIAATGDDGREITLKKNGQWEYANGDRFATVNDGTRVRLKENGSWEYNGHAALQTEQEFREQSIGVQLDKVITRYTKIKPGSKGLRTIAETTFFVSVDISRYSDQPISVDLSDARGLSVADNRDNAYNVISVTPANQTLKPGSNYNFEVMVEGAPQSHSLLAKVKNITLNIDRSVFATDSDITLSFDTDDIERKRVERL